MTKENYQRFINKIDQLNKLIELINSSPEKYKLFVQCKTHKDVVELASRWGFDIGRRWGE